LGVLALAAAFGALASFLGFLPLDFSFDCALPLAFLDSSLAFLASSLAFLALGEDGPLSSSAEEESSENSVLFVGGRSKGPSSSSDEVSSFLLGPPDETTTVEPFLGFGLEVFTVSAGISLSVCIPRWAEWIRKGFQV
jgi:hypothetical protein